MNTLLCAFDTKASFGLLRVRAVILKGETSLATNKYFGRWSVMSLITLPYVVRTLDGVCMRFHKR